MNIVSMSLAASLTILAVIILRSLFIHILPKKTFILLWGVVVLKLLIPASVPSRLSIWNMIDAFVPSRNEAPADAVPVSAAIFTHEAAAEIPDESIIANITGISAAGGGGSLADPSIFFWFWFAGTLICAMGFLLPHLRWRGIYKTALPLESGFIKQWITSHPLRRKLRVKQSDRVNSPLTCGIWKPVIVLPKTLDWQQETRLSYILTHEYVHIRRFDTFWKWILAFTLAVHWFNPLVWIMYILANRDIELSCDEAVVRNYVRSGGEDAKSDYAMTLIALVEKRNELMSLCANFSKNVVEERIISIMKIKKLSFFTVLIAFLLICGISMVFATGKTLPQATADSPLNFARIPGGTFMMGSAVERGYGFPQENRHEVTVSPFYIGTYPVTHMEYQAVMGSNPSSINNNGLPAEQVTWFDAIEFCNRVSRLDSLTPVYIINGTDVTWDRNANGYRLPTEAEWEYAARAGTNTAFNSDGTHPWGLINMPGNFWEWCWDWYADYPGSAETDPVGADSGANRVMRGGQWYCARDTIATLRSHNRPSNQGAFIGFRLVRSL